MILSPQAQGKELTYSATMGGHFLQNFQNSYDQRDQYVTKSLNGMTEIDLNAGEGTINISSKIYYERKEI